MDSIFHYCSTNTFMSVVKNRSIWLSSLSLSNDALEGKLFSRAIESLLRRDNVSDDLARKVLDEARAMEEMIDAFGFCLSEERDLLSQWRGYADDAKGFCIGFSKSYLEELCGLSDGNVMELKPVKYENHEHEELLSATYGKIRDLINSGRLIRPGIISPYVRKKSYQELMDDYKSSEADVRRAIFDSMFEVFQLKDCAFKEEKEWRIISHVLYKVNVITQVRAVSNRLIPYREVKFFEPHQKSILSVFLGPKNTTPIDVVSAFLRSHGFLDVSVIRSSASYR